jgi:hypothetical protein
MTATVATRANLRVDVLGIKDSMTIGNWFAGEANYGQLGDIELSDSGLKLAAQFDTQGYNKLRPACDAVFSALFGPSPPSSTLKTLIPALPPPLLLSVAVTATSSSTFCMCSLPARPYIENTGLIVP